MIFLAGLHRAERGIADRFAAIATAPSPWPAIDPGKAIPWVEQRAAIVLADSQRAAVSAALASKVLVITGGPGAGKTTIVNAILKALAAKGVRVALCAPSGQAAKQASEAAGIEAKTIHRLLEVNPASAGSRCDAEHPIDAEVEVVDETSMVDVALMHALLRAGDEVCIRCEPCGREGWYRRGGLIARFGADTSVPEVLNRITADCPRK